jgi:hypothetical protein
MHNTRSRLVIITIALSSITSACTASRHESSSSSAVDAATTSNSDVVLDPSTTAAGVTAPGTVVATSTATPTTIANTTTVATAAPETTTTAAATTTAAPTTTVPEPTTTTIVTAGAIVIVANATKVNNGASKLSTLLGKAGFTMGAVTNGAGNEVFLDTTKVYCLPGSEAVAGSVAMLLGGVPVAYMPTPAPITAATAGLGDASVLVMLGKDIAGKTPPGLKGL